MDQALKHQENQTYKCHVNKPSFKPENLAQKIKHVNKLAPGYTHVQCMELAMEDQRKLLPC